LGENSSTLGIKIGIEKFEKVGKIKGIKFILKQSIHMI
jgi:hypothetical protein